MAVLQVGSIIRSHRAGAYANMRTFRRQATANAPSQGVAKVYLGILVVVLLDLALHTLESGKYRQTQAPNTVMSELVNQLRSPLRICQVRLMVFIRIHRSCSRIHIRNTKLLT